MAAGRISVTAPLTAAAVLLVLTGALLVEPLLLRDLGVAATPLFYATDLFVPAALAGVLLLAPLAVRRRIPVPPPPPPFGGWGPPPSR